MSLLNEYMQMEQQLKQLQANMEKLQNYQRLQS